MTIIRITEFKGYSKEDMIGFLNIHGKSFYTVVVPKRYTLDIDGDHFLQDYYNAMYTGQLLYRISHDIFWTTPDPCTKDTFSFIVLTTAIKTFASLLQYLNESFDADHHPNTSAKFEETAYSLAYLRDEEKLTCYNFAEIIRQYNSENEP
jgi:hypothetical protein